MSRKRFGVSRQDGDFSQEVIETVWRKGRTVPGCDPAVRRMDICGAYMEKRRYGDTTPHGPGWEIDHIVPVARGGTDEIANLQPLQWENNRAKNDSAPGGWRCALPRRGGSGGSDGA